MNFLVTLAAFAVALGLLVLVHEFGHYWVARLCGVKVLRFSLGFGKPLMSRRRGETEWSIAAFPLGGYVKMLDEREGEVEPHELDRAFNRMPVWKRFAIVAAGPSSNLILAVLLYWGLFMHGVPGLKPLIGEVVAGTAVSRAGFSSGETIVEVGGQTVKSWDDVRWALLRHALEKGALEIGTDRGVSHYLDLSGVHVDDPERDFMRDAGFRRYEPSIPPVVDGVVAGGGASRAGVLPGDEIVAIDGEKVADWTALAEKVRKSPGKLLHLSVKRGGKIVPLAATPQPVEEGNERVGKLGISPRIDEAALQKLFIQVRYAPPQALLRAAKKTWNTSIFTVQMLGRMLVGEVSLKSIGGPFTIADYAGQSAKLGITAYLNFLALISISLGVLNLLPIPVLDGGHLMYYMAEIIRGRPLPERVMELGQKVGMFLLFLLMALALYNDLQRLITG